MKKTLAFIMSLIFVCTAFVGCEKKDGNLNSESSSYNSSETTNEIKNESYKNLQNGDTFFFGEYPQSLVEDDVVISKLDELLKENNWINMNHYSIAKVNGTPTYGKSNNWWYQDVEYDGCKYRALSMINKYYAGLEVDYALIANAVTEGPSNEPFWFKYEPISWKILDKDNGIVVCSKVIDSMEYNYDIAINPSSQQPYTDANEYFCKDSSLTSYVGDYSISYLRKWLNDTFYNTAFSSKNQKAIIETTLTYDKAADSKYQVKETKDKVYILSDVDLRNNEKYNFNPSKRSDAEDENRVFESTEYASKVTSGYTDTTLYWTRTSDIRKTEIVNNVGKFKNMNPFYINGVLPALTLDFKKAVK